MSMLTFYVSIYLAIGGILFVVMALDGNEKSMEGMRKPLIVIFMAMVLCSIFWPVVVAYGLLEALKEFKK